MDSFERWLGNTGRALQYPPTPSLANRVAARLRVEPERRRSFLQPILGSGRRLGPALGLVLALFILGLALAAIPATRTAVAEFFGLRHIEVIRIEETPTPPTPEVPATPNPSPTAVASFEAAGRTTIAEARSKAAFPIRIPSYPEGLGEPDAVYFQDLQPGQQVILVYRSRPGLTLESRQADGVLFTLFQFRTEGIFQKGIYLDTLVEELRVSGIKALWFQGAAHILQYRDAQGNLRREFKRLVEGNTLAWEVEGITYRLETSLPKEEAVKMAESLR